MKALPAAAASALELLQMAQPAPPTYDSSAYSSILGSYYIALSVGYSASMLEEYDLNSPCAYAIDSVSGTPSIIEAVLYQEFFQDVGPWFYTACKPWAASVCDGSQIEISESEASQIMERHPYEAIEFLPIPAM